MIRKKYSSSCFYMSNSKQNTEKPGLSNLLFEMGLCIIIPTIILKKLSAPEQLGSSWALILALSLPLGFGIYKFFEEKKIKFVPALGFISILLTGGIGLLQLDSGYIAIKEAAIPFIIGLATVISIKTPYPLVRTFLYNDTVLQTDKVDEALRANKNQTEFDRVMVNATWLLAASFLLSSILNYVLAKWIVVSPSGTPEFNDQLGTMNLLSYPVIVIPCMVITMFALFYVFKNIKKLTGLELEDIVHS